ncbi:DUF2975 domain-containing protein [Pseudomonas simiae]|uniref:DUF2975 domain-containing protein n=1 Tax=Pseudomonas simiae TaxID=321846 RepID=UPI00273403D8|nr:DUF2975 domain-containing protein [Pseudomonas simiae]WLG33554.1 DUF2975 domain-containing protein [Pseudomonas simiae]WLI23527.1 DUF2975 domain-containing protein [Pseudomonas simiae]
MLVNRLAQFSQRMAVLTLMFIACMLILNAALWVFPIMGSNDGWGIGFSLSGVMLNQLAVQTEMLAWWQILGAILVSSVPLVALASGLNHLCRLFQGYARGEYFSYSAAVHLGKVGRGVILWVISSFICTPILSILVTLHAPPGQRLLTISFTSADFVALFLAGCIAVIARILVRASEVDSENQTFV